MQCECEQNLMSGGIFQCMPHYPLLFLSFTSQTSPCLTYSPNLFKLSITTVIDINKNFQLLLLLQKDKQKRRRKRKFLYQFWMLMKSNKTILDISLTTSPKETKEKVKRLYYLTHIIHSQYPKAPKKSHPALFNRFSLYL